jgi:DNA-binding GntR family transcriptional regulator
VKIEASRRTLRAQALAILRNELLAGRFTPGERVNEVQIAAEIGISRGTLREAMRNLEQEGLLVSVAHRGTFVRRFTVREAEELQEVRASLETTAAIGVARNWNRAVRDHLREHLNRLRSAYEAPLPFPERVKADLAFHEAICESSGNRTLLRLWQSLIGNITVMVLNVGVERMTRLQDPAEHERLFESIGSRDEAVIRDAFAQVFEAGRREVAAAVAEHAESDMSAQAIVPGVERIPVGSEQPAEL